MSKKAKEIVEAAPRFKQPWQGFLSIATVLVLAYCTYTWFLHPVWGIFTKMAQMNAAVAFWFGYLFGQPALGLQLAINNPNYVSLYPLGYIVNWVSFFIFCIVWFISIGVLARSFTPSTSRLRRQPWQGIIMLALSMIFSAITWYILGVVMKWTALEMILLGTIGFAIFPVWATIFHYWPFAQKRPTMNAYVRGAIYIVISWVLTFLVRGIISMLMWRSPIAIVNTMYLCGDVLEPLTPTEPYDVWMSAFFAIIVGTVIMSQLNPFPNLAQPKRGLLNIILAIVVGLILWGILAVAIAPGYSSIIYEVPFATLLGPTNVPILIPFTYVNHSTITAFLTFPLITLLAGQFTFNMWPWAKYGNKSGLMLVIAGFIIGIIVYYIIMVSPLNLAASITGANLFPGMGGTQSLAVSYLGIVSFMLTKIIPLVPILAWVIQPLMIAYTSFLVYFTGVAATIGHSIMYAWTVTVGIFYLLIYEAFDHWPWK